MDNDPRLDSWRDERNSAVLYETIASLESNPKLAEIYRRLSAEERGHAETWAEQLRAAGTTVPAFSPSWRTRTLIRLARRFGAGLILPSLATLEDIGGHGYAQASEAAASEMATQERSHARVLRRIAQASGGLEGGVVAKLERRHRAAGGNALRAAVLGANDGLVSNLSLVMGVAGADLSGRAILITGLAGLLAGAFSMALGEWLSVQSSRELYQHQIGLERAEIASSPEEEAEELALIYQARGVEEGQARAMAGQIVRDQAAALETLSREELGIDPQALGGSAWEAAGTSFVLFAAGAIIPVAPYMFTAGLAAVGLSLLLSAVGLFAIGAGITLFTARPVVASGLRQVLFGLAAAAITFGIGRLIGVNLGG
jgi:VIT1/CCC1 family predicted Fe2+/Mn2+ transporter